MCVRFKSPKKSSKFCLSERIAGESLISKPNAQRKDYNCPKGTPPAEVLLSYGYCCFATNFSESSTRIASAGIGAPNGATASKENSRLSLQ